MGNWVSKYCDGTHCTFKTVDNPTYIVLITNKEKSILNSLRKINSKHEPDSRCYFVPLVPETQIPTVTICLLASDSLKSYKISYCV